MSRRKNVRASIVAIVMAALVIGCSDDDESAAQVVTPPPPDSLPGGIPPDMCAAGFEHDGDAGCDAILPPAACPAGLMAVPGETECRPVMPCSEGVWGDIVFDAATQHVDQSFSGLSNGSITAPWATIGEAVVAAPPGGLVAVAAGRYVEDIAISAKAVRIHGVCPEQVELVATGGAIAAVDIRTGASGSEVRGIAIVGDVIGVLLSGSTGVLLEQVWVHDNARRGIDAESALGPTSCIVRGSLIEGNGRSGVFVAGAEIAVDACVVRDTIAVDSTGGRGIVAQTEMVSGDPSVVSVSTSVIERNIQVGIAASGSELLVEASVLRDNQADADGAGGGAIGIQSSLDTGAASLAAVRGSVLERNRHVGIFVAGSEATIENTVVRDTIADGQGRFGRGIGIQPRGDSTGASIVTLRALLIARNLGFGAFWVNSDVTVDSCLIRDTLPNTEAQFGDGLLAQYGGGPTNAVVDGSTVEGSARAGVASFGSFVAISNSALRCNAFDLDGETFNGEGSEFDDRGGNRCGCPAEPDNCTAVSASLEAPQPLD
jgi:hypothetical protein